MVSDPRGNVDYVGMEAFNFLLLEICSQLQFPQKCVLMFNSVLKLSGISD